MDDRRQHPDLDARPRDDPGRRTAVLAAGIAAAVVIAAVVILAIAAAGDDDPVPAGSSGTTTASVVPTEPGATAAPTGSTASTASTAPAVEPTTAVEPATAAASTTPADDVVDYVPAGQYAGPTFDERTTPVADPLADGLYFSSNYTSDGTTMTFQLIQRIRGQACIDEFGDGADAACASDAGTINEPTATVTMTASDPSETSVIHFDNATFLAYRVPADEFIRLAAGQTPSIGAPDGYAWIPWGTYLTIQDGRVVSAHQQFSS